MRTTPRGFVSLAFFASASVLAACQGNIGGGSGLSIPQAPGYQQPAGPGGANGQSRQRVLDGAVYLSSKLTAVPLPQLAGYSVSLALGTPGPVTAASPLSSAGAALARSGTKTLTAKAGAHASPSAHPSAPPSAAVSPEPSGSASASGSAAPEPSASGSPSSEAGKSLAATAVSGQAADASASAAPSASPSMKPAHAASPSASGSSLPRFETKTIVDPDDAPPPPTPMPTGEVQTFIKRSAIIRGYVLTGSDLPLYGLGAVRFTMPSTELTPKRGFTVAVFESGKHHHDKLVTYDTEPTITDGIVYSTLTAPLVLKKGGGYLLMIYGDDEAAPITPASVPPGYPGPGNNPFPAGSGNPQPGYTQVPGYPPGASPTLYPGQTPYPAQATPYQILPSPYHT